jgi:hypothetical protein
MALDLSTHVVETSAGPKKVLVVTPTVEIIGGRDKLEELRGSVATSTVDREIVDHLAGADFGDYRAFVFRGRSEDGAGSWSFGPDLSEDEKGELSHLMFRAQLPLNRLCAAKGMFDNLYIEFGQAELAAFARATQRIAAEIRTRVPRYATQETAEARLARLELWLVERYAFYSAMPLSVLLQRVIPPRLQRNADRKDELRALLAGVPDQLLHGA